MSGGTRIRTGDTMIFSHVLYQLSYPARDLGRITAGDSTARRDGYQAFSKLVVAGRRRPIRLPSLGEPAKLEGGLDHLFGKRADDGLRLLAWL